jgi:hypothetical protein
VYWPVGSVTVFDPGIGTSLRDSDLCPGHGAARGIGNRAADGAVKLLRGNRKRQHQGKQSGEYNLVSDLHRNSPRAVPVWRHKPASPASASQIPARPSGDFLTPLRPQMGRVALPIGQPRVDLRAAIGTQLFRLGQSRNVKIDQRDL